MVENINATEITNMITNREYIKNDMMEITNIVRKLLNDKYISRMDELVSRHKENVTNNPPKEVMLMQAIKPFMQKEAQINVDKVIEMMNIINTAKNLQRELERVKSEKMNRDI
ncbi:MAG: hypothetical protein GX308_01025 [Epulopiscium sp.]|nr:hypothetical protein [Candidatus Epulonipiscium sp.]